jgi:hypothetical protein
VNSIQQNSSSTVKKKRKAADEETESQDQLELDLLRITDSSLTCHPSRYSSKLVCIFRLFHSVVSVKKGKEDYDIKVSDPYCACCDDGGKEPLIICETCSLVHHESCLKRDWERYTPIEEDPWLCPMCKMKVCSHKLCYF